MMRTAIIVPVVDTVDAPATPAVVISISRPTRAQVLRLAADLECCEKTAEKILLKGPASIRTRAIRERAERALAAMGMASK
jgi:hypothetical protein